MPTPTQNLSATIKAAEVIREPERFAPKSATHKKLTKQLQNSLWLRICSGRIAFMLCWQLQNSTKFHFGKPKTNKSICRAAEKQQQHQQHQQPHYQYSKIIGKYRKQRRRCRRSGALRTAWILRAKDTDTDRDTDKDTATDRDKAIASLLAPWIRSSSSASNGTVSRLTWQ